MKIKKFDKFLLEVKYNKNAYEYKPKDHFDKNGKKDGYDIYFDFINKDNITKNYIMSLREFYDLELGKCYEIQYTVEEQFDMTNPEIYDKETDDLKDIILRFYSKLLNILDDFIKKYFDYNINIAFGGNAKRPGKTEGYFDMANNYIKYIKPDDVNVEIMPTKDKYNLDAYILKINKKENE